MKKIIFAAVVATAFATPAFADTTGSTGISGIVATNCSLTAPPAVNNLNLGIATDQSIGSIAVSCNATSYTVNAKSMNGGKLSSNPAVTTAPAYAYQIGVGSAFQSLTTTDAVLFTKASLGLDLGGLPFERTALVKVKVGALSGGVAYAGTYSDTVYVSIVAN